MWYRQFGCKRFSNVTISAFYRCIGRRKRTWCRNNYLIYLKVKVIELYLWVLCLNYNYFYRTYSYFCTTSLLSVHKPSKLKVGRVRNSGTHVFKTILELFNCIFSSSSSRFQIFFYVWINACTDFVITI